MLTMFIGDTSEEIMVYIFNSIIESIHFVHFTISNVQCSSRHVNDDELFPYLYFSFRVLAQQVMYIEKWSSAVPSI